MSSQKRKASHPDIKQYFCSKAKEEVSVVSQPKTKQTSVAVAVKIIFQQCRKNSIQQFQKSMIQRKAFSCLFQLTVSQKKHLAMLLFNHGLS